MRRTAKILTMLAGGGAALVVLGFFIFAGLATQRTGPDDVADAIVVLTGAEFRIAEGARLLEQKRGTRMLITGVNPKVSRTDLERITRLKPALLRCCVDIDTEALDTIGNARETAQWIAKHAFKSIILVTSNFHMPRSRTEFALAMPGVRIIPHPVVPRGFPREAWWLNSGAARILLSEYLKFLPAAARLTAERLISPWHSSSVAVSGADARLLARV